MLGIVASPDIWRFQPHPEVWVLVAGLATLYTYAIKVIGPRAVPAGQPVVRRRQVGCFVAGLTLLWLASDWPMHDLAEEYLYSVHMLQHMMLSYFMPPLMLLATPTWLARLVVGQGRVWTGFKWLAKPVVAGVTFNAFVMVSHVPAVVNHAVDSGNGFAALLAAHRARPLGAADVDPRLRPVPRAAHGPGRPMIYLFAMSVIPTVPAGWLTFAGRRGLQGLRPRAAALGDQRHDGPAAGRRHHEGRRRFFLWVIITFLFFTRFMGRWEEQNTPRPVRRAPVAAAPETAPTGEAHEEDEHVLTYEEVTRAFEAAPPVPEPDRPTTGT